MSVTVLSKTQVTAENDHASIKTNVDAVNEFISDLSLFMTYNNLGKINLNEELALSKDILRLKIIQFVF